MSVQPYDQENVTIFWDFGQSTFNISQVAVHPEVRLICTQKLPKYPTQAQTLRFMKS